MFCSKCGKALPEDAHFCPKCSVRTSKGVEAGISASQEDLKDTFAKMGAEMEKALSIAGREIKKPSKRREKKLARQSVKNVSSAQIAEKRTLLMLGSVISAAKN